MSIITETDILELLLTDSDVTTLSATPIFSGLTKQEIIERAVDSHLDIYTTLGYTGLEDYVRGRLRNKNASLDEFAQEVVAMAYDDATAEGEAEIRSILDCDDESTLDDLLYNRQNASTLFDKIYRHYQGSNLHHATLCDLHSLYYFSLKICG